MDISRERGRAVQTTVGDARERAARVIAAVVARCGWMAAPIALALGVRLGVFVAADVGARLLAPKQFSGAVNGWFHDDAAWYISIAAHGYGFSRVAPSNINFYPLYPLLTHGLSGLTGIVSNQREAPILAGMVISWLAFAGACACVYRITLDRFGATAAYRVTLLLATFPFGFYFGAPYTESLFLLLATLAFLSVERGWWGVAGGAALLAGAERPTGLLIGGCVVLAYALERARARKLPGWDALWLLLTPLGFLAFVFYCWRRFGDPLAFMTAERVGWGRGGVSSAGLIATWRLLRHPGGWLVGGDYDTILFGVYALIAAVFVLLIIWVFRRMGPVYAFYCLATILAPLITYPSADGLGRYLSVTFPVFIVAGAALARRPALADVLTLGGAMLLGVFAILFTLGYPIY